MAKARSTDTLPELALRRMLREHGFKGYRKNVKRLPGKPDCVFIGRKIAIFVHGCFWHCCPRCYDTRWREPKTNQDYWLPKLERNLARDIQHRKSLEAMGYQVIVVWECEIKKEPDTVWGRLEAVLKP